MYTHTHTVKDLELSIRNNADKCIKCTVKISINAHFFSSIKLREIGASDGKEYTSLHFTCVSKRAQEVEEISAVGVWLTYSDVKKKKIKNTANARLHPVS